MWRRGKPVAFSPPRSMVSPGSTGMERMSGIGIVKASNHISRLNRWRLTASRVTAWERTRRGFRVRSPLMSMRGRSRTWSRWLWVRRTSVTRDCSSRESWVATAPASTATTPFTRKEEG